MSDVWDVAAEIVGERQNQVRKWGPQHHPDGTHTEFWRPFRDNAIRVSDGNASLGLLTWLDILKEEVYEAFAETDPALLRAELIQVAAVAAAWMEDIDSR
jgi:hypothetical protein